MTNTPKNRKQGRQPIIWEYHICSYRQAAVVGNNGCATLALLNVAGGKVVGEKTKFRLSAMIMTPKQLSMYL